MLVDTGSLKFYETLSVLMRAYYLGMREIPGTSGNKICHFVCSILLQRNGARANGYIWCQTRYVLAHATPKYSYGHYAWLVALCVFFWLFQLSFYFPNVNFRICYTKMNIYIL